MRNENGLTIFGMPLPYTIISSSSKDDDEPISGGNVNWISARNHSFPQSIILELDEESLVNGIRVTVHKDFPPSSMTISLGVASNVFRNSRPKSYDADYSNRQEISYRDFQSREILGVDSLKDEVEMSYVELDKGVLLPLKTPQNMQQKKVVRLYESDSEDEEILFSKEMLKRLKKREEILKNPTLPDVSDASSEQGSSSKNPSSLSPPLSDRTKKMVLDDIEEKHVERRKTGRQIYFGRRMNEFHNIVRVLERKKEEAIWDERYAEAAAIEKNLKDLNSRESGLRQLLEEREIALKNDDLIEAQRAKDRFDKNLGDALNLPTFRGLVSAQQSFHSRRIGTEGQVLSRILSEYDSNTRPPIRDHASNSAILVMTNVHINRVNWKKHSAEVDLYLRQQWQDNRLKYDVKTREGIQEVRLPANRKIWEPDTYFSSGRELERDGGKYSKNIIIEPSGYVRSSERVVLEIPYVNGASFPYTNSKQFTIRLGSYNYPVDDVVYLWANSPPLLNPVEVSSDLLRGDYVFEEANAGDCVGNYTIGVYSCIDANVTFSTCFLGSLMSWFLPSLLLLIASWLHFWIHGSWSVPRTASAAIPFLIFAAYFLFCGIDSHTQSTWFAFCQLMTFFSLIEYFFVICCGIRRSIRYKTLDHAEDHPMGAAKETVEVAYNQGCSAFRNNNGIDVIARVLFPIITLIFLIVYFIFLA
ncbi:unnamed protein product [Caenorhabditis bovis]|uniref:Neurotransmitter-gated ion-channel ligand-binding domain-containing protein n=1 Tax=Caenorhabditis bovis TaxID=2654633 RepID=A0A8S1EWZ2_9PELO|nr:unnamed protein product [Caenorhabditis bovis]